MQTPAEAPIPQVNDLNGFDADDIRLVVSRRGGEMVAMCLKMRRELLDRSYNIRKNKAHAKRHQAQKLDCWTKLRALGDTITPAEKLRIESYIEEADIKLEYAASLKEQWELEMVGILEEYERQYKRVDAILENNR